MPFWKLQIWETATWEVALAKNYLTPNASFIMFVKHYFRPRTNITNLGDYLPRYNVYSTPAPYSNHSPYSSQGAPPPLHISPTSIRRERGAGRPYSADIGRWENNREQDGEGGRGGGPKTNFSRDIKNLLHIDLGLTKNANFTEYNILSEPTKCEICFFLF